MLPTSGHPTHRLTTPLPTRGESVTRANRPGSDVHTGTALPARSNPASQHTVPTPFPPRLPTDRGATGPRTESTAPAVQSPPHPRDPDPFPPPSRRVRWGSRANPSRSRVGPGEEA